MIPPRGPHYILTLTCDDQPGIVAAVAGVLASHGSNIEESSQFGDAATGRFFMRVRFASPETLPEDAVRGAIAPVAHRFSMVWNLHRADSPARAIIMVSKFDHCLTDLLHRTSIGSLPLTVTRIVSNHDDARRHADLAGLAFENLAAGRDSRDAREARLRDLVRTDNCELIILARYMQILSPELAADFAGRIINIHHSFLPGFKGARPYHQAHERGVKLIGATAHYVTSDLDEGPIIEQETERVSHTMSVAELVGAGRDIERRVLARAVRYHAERRVLINGAKTVVFA